MAIVPGAYRTWLRGASRVAKNLAVVVAIVSGLSVILSAAWSLYQFGVATRDRSRTARIAQLTTHESFGQVLKRYHEIELTTDNFMRRHRRGSLDLPAFLKRYETGSSMYYSPELKDFREIHQFYEELGALIRYGAVDFELVFQLITFPSDFQEATRPLQQFLSDHWFELRADPGEKRLRDFGFNFAELEKNYEARRHGRPVSWSSP
jgi:hypothetical protein